MTTSTIDTIFYPDVFQSPSDISMTHSDTSFGINRRTEEVTIQEVQSSTIKRHSPRSLFHSPTSDKTPILPHHTHSNITCHRAPESSPDSGQAQLQQDFDQHLITINSVHGVSFIQSSNDSHNVTNPSITTPHSTMIISSYSPDSASHSDYKSTQSKELFCPQGGFCSGL